MRLPGGAQRSLLTQKPAPLPHRPCPTAEAWTSSITLGHKGVLVGHTTSNSQVEIRPPEIRFLELPRRTVSAISGFLYGLATSCSSERTQHTKMVSTAAA